MQAIKIAEIMIQLQLKAVTPDDVCQLSPIPTRLKNN